MRGLPMESAVVAKPGCRRPLLYVFHRRGIPFRTNDGCSSGAHTDRGPAYWIYFVLSISIKSPRVMPALRFPINLQFIIIGQIFCFFSPPFVPGLENSKPCPSPVDRSFLYTFVVNFRLYRGKYFNLFTANRQ